MADPNSHRYNSHQAPGRLEDQVGDRYDISTEELLHG
jgi:hypothetical protein